MALWWSLFKSEWGDGFDPGSDRTEQGDFCTLDITGGESGCRNVARFGDGFVYAVMSTADEYHIITTDSDMVITNKTKVENIQNPSFHDIIVTNGDANIILCGYCNDIDTANTYSFYIVKFDSNLVLQKEVVIAGLIPSNAKFSQLTGLSELPNGDIVYSGYEPVTGSSIVNAYMLITDSNLNKLYSKYFGYNGRQHQFHDVVTVGSRIFAVGHNFNTSSTVAHAFIMEFDTTLTRIAEKHYHGPSTITHFKKAIINSSGNIVVLVYELRNPYDLLVLVEIGTDLVEINRSVSFTDVLNPYEELYQFWFEEAGDGGYVVATSKYVNARKMPVFALSSTLALETGVKFFANKHVQPLGICKLYDDGGIVISGHIQTFANVSTPVFMQVGTDLSLIDNQILPTSPPVTIEAIASFYTETPPAYTTTGGTTPESTPTHTEQVPRGIAATSTLTIDTCYDIGELNAGFPGHVDTVATDGILAGGNTGTVSTSIEWLHYADDTVSAFAVSLAQATEGCAAVGDGSNVYIAGGTNAGVLNNIERIVLADETVNTLSATLSQAREGLSYTSFANAGWFAGGYTGSATVITIDGLDFAFETSTNFSTALTSPTKYSAAETGSTFAVVAGGQNSGGTSIATLEFFTWGGSSIGDTASASLTTARSGLTSTMDVTNSKAYFAGGDALTSIETVLLDTKTQGTIAAVLPAAKDRGAGLSGDGSGYHCGGTTGGTSIYKLGNTSETISTVADTLAVARSKLAGESKKEQTSPATVIPGAGFFGGGATGGSATIIDKISFVDDTAAAIAATVVVGVYWRASCASATHGYWAGGKVTGSVASIDGLDFSDETSFNPSATLSANTAEAAGCASTTKGYFGGGYVTNVTNKIDAIVFSTDTMSNPAATLSVARYILAACGSSSTGYWGGGSTGLNLYSNEIDGITFSTEAAFDTSTTLSAPRERLTACASGSHGYFAGGEKSGSTVIDDINGIRFSDDSAFNPAVVLSLTRKDLGACASSSHGYFGGGFAIGTRTNVIDGVDFSDDSAFNPAATLSTSRDAISAFSSPTTYEY